MTDPCGRVLLWLASGAGGRPPADAADPVTADRLVAAAVGEGLAGLLFAQARAGGWHRRLPERAGRRLESIYYLTVQTNLRYLAALREIAAEGVPFVLMQGAALLVTTYADPGLRPLSDLDLWVLPEDRARLTAALRRRSFDENPLAPGVFRRGETLVDVHTHLHWADRIRSSRYLFAGEPGAVHRRCVTLGWEGISVRCLDPCDQAVYLTVHAIKHNLERLIWLADLNRLAAGWRAADWEVFRRRAREFGQSRLAAILAYLRRTLFDLPTPVEATAGARLTPLDTYLLRRRRRGPLPKWSSLSLLSTGSQARRIRFAFESTFPRPEVLRQVIRDSEAYSHARLYGLRAAQMLGMLRC
jgi:hypothetical protein